MENRKLLKELSQLRKAVNSALIGALFSGSCGSDKSRKCLREVSANLSRLENEVAGQLRDEGVEVAWCDSCKTMSTLNGCFCENCGRWGD
jgi:hypothetical protein